MALANVKGVFRVTTYKAAEDILKRACHADVVGVAASRMAHDDTIVDVDGSAVHWRTRSR